MRSVDPPSVTLDDPSVWVIVNPAVSSSVVVTDIVPSDAASKLSSEFASSTDSVIVDDCVPSTRSSSTPVIVIVWAVSQFAAVNVRVAGDAVTSPVSDEVTEITTSDEGSAFRTTEILSVVPVSSTSVAPSVSAMVNPAASSSVVVADKVWSATEP